MKIAVGCDHAGFSLKPRLIEVICSLGHQVQDCGSFTPDPVDFPDISWEVCSQVRSGQADRGMLICGTGVGACIAANKIPGIRAALCHDVHCAHQGVEHDDVNVMCLGAQIVGPWLAADLVATFLNACFTGDEDLHRRVGKLHELELRAARELANKES